MRSILTLLYERHLTHHLRGHPLKSTLNPDVKVAVRQAATARLRDFAEASRRESPGAYRHYKAQLRHRQAQASEGPDIQPGTSSPCSRALDSCPACLCTPCRGLTGQLLPGTCLKGNDCVPSASCDHGHERGVSVCFWRSLYAILYCNSPGLSIPLTFFLSQYAKTWFTRLPGCSGSSMYSIDGL